MVIIEKANVKSFGEVIESNKCKRQERPKHKGVRETGQRPFANDLRLAHYFRKEMPKTWTNRVQFKIGVALRSDNSA